LALIALIAFLLLFAILSGAATAFAGQIGVFIFGGLVLGAVALLLPLRWLVITLVFMSFVVAGQLTYFAGVEKANWIPYLMGLLLLVRFPIDAMQQHSKGTVRAAEPSGAILGARLSIWLYMATLLASTLINASPPFQAVLGSKDLLFIWGLYVVLAAGLIKPGLVERIWLALPWLMLLQLPLILYQRFVVAAGRLTAAPWDAVVGAFGGNPDGGGASGAMGTFCVIGMVTVVSLWRSGLIPGWQAILLSVAGLLGIMLAEVKFMILLLPVAFFLMSARELVRNPVKALMAIISGFALAFAILIIYSQLYTDRGGRSQTFQEYATNMIEANLDPNYVAPKRNQLGRVTSIVFWYQKHSMREPSSLLIGHGIGSSRRSLSYIGEAQKPYALNLGRTSFTLLLWEVGIIGTAAYLALHCFAYFALFRMSGDPTRSTRSRVVLASMAVAIVMLAAGIPYTSDLLGTYQIQVILMLCLGYMVVSGRRDAGVEERKPAAEGRNKLARA